MRLILILVLLTSCAYVHNRPVYPITPTNAVTATFKVSVSTNNGMHLGSGTAWVVAIEGDFTYLLTAGHVCSGDKYKLLGHDNETYDADETMKSEDPDLCLLKHKGWISRPLSLAHTLPKYGQDIWYVGAPLGIYGSEASPMHHGYYVGTTHMSLPAAPGASGSAIWTPKGVFGVLVTVNRYWHHISGFVSIQEIRDFLKHAGL